MMAVFVGISLQVKEDGLSSPSFIFICAMFGSFLIAAMLHPQKFWCVVPLLIYYLSIPSMYLLLIIYSITNLNNVTWGTREVLTKKTTKELQEEQKQAKEQKKKEAAGVLSFLGGRKAQEELEGGVQFSLGNLFTCMLFTQQKGQEEKHQAAQIMNSVNDIGHRVDLLTRTIELIHGVPSVARRKSFSKSSVKSGDGLSAVNEEHEEDDVDSDSNSNDSQYTDRHGSKLERDHLINPYWIEDKDLKRATVDYLTGQEIQFWKELITKYLYPIDADKQKEDQIKNDLKELRNKSVFAFFMFNALFILVVFLLQLNKDSLYVEWPLGAKTNITFIEETNEVRIDKEYLHLEPIGLVFVIFFATIIIIIQFFGMLFHRFGTLAHILSSIELKCCAPKDSETLTLSTETPSK